MPAEWEAAAQIEQVRLRGGLPSTDARFTDTRLRSLLTQELRDSVAPLVHEAKAEHGILTHSVSVSAGTATYRIPTRAFGGTLRDVVWLDSNGNAYPLHQRTSSDVEILSRTTQTGDPRYYYLRNSSIILVPTPGVAGTLSLPYYARANTLVDVASCATILGVTSLGSGQYRVTVTDNAVNSALVNGLSLDVVRSTPGFECLAVATTPTNPDDAGATLTVDLTLDAAPEVGDYLCNPGESPVPQVPVELHALLQARAAFVAVPSTGEGGSTAQALAAQVADLEAKARAWLRPRVESGTPPPGRGMRMHPLLGAAG